MMKFDDVFRAQLRELLIWRRDVRRFRTEALPPGTVERLIDMACLAPSVGLSQPWRFVIVDDPARRRATREGAGQRPAARSADYFASWKMMPSVWRSAGTQRLTPWRRSTR